MDRYPNISRLKRDGDLVTLKSINDWAEITAPAAIAANDNIAQPKGHEPEPEPYADTRMEALRAEDLIAAYNKGTYSISMHHERFREPKSGKAAPAFRSETTEDAMHRCIDEKRFREKLGRHADVLDLCLTDSTAADIGELIAGPGSSRRTYEAIGARAVKDAAQKLQKLMAA